MKLIIMISCMQFLERFYCLMANNNEQLTLGDMLKSLSNVARLVKMMNIFNIQHLL